MSRHLLLPATCSASTCGTANLDKRAEEAGGGQNVHTFSPGGGAVGAGAGERGTESGAGVGNAGAGEKRGLVRVGEKGVEAGTKDY